jgi:hypothetical protein
MEESERDSAEDWLLPERSRPPSLAELVARIDEAMTIAKVSEAAVMSVGAAALDAAEQARRAAELAERASAAIAEARQAPAGGGGAAPADEDLRQFSARADRVAARLRRLERGAHAGSRG